jgi:hypothetical protein
MNNDVVMANDGISPYPLSVNQNLLDSVYFGWDYYNWSQQSEIQKTMGEKFSHIRPTNIWLNDADTLPLFGDYETTNDCHNLYSVMRHFYNQNFKIYNHDTTHLIKKDIPFIYIIGTKSGPLSWKEDRGKLFLNIKQHTKEYIRKGKVLLVVDMSNEGFPMESVDDMSISEAGYYEHIGKQISDLAIKEDFPLDNMVYLTSNYKIKNKYKSISQMVLNWTEIIMKNREPNPISNLNKYHLNTIDVWNGFGVSTDDVNPEINIGVDSLDKWAENKFEEAFNYKKDNLSDMKSFLCLCKLVKDWRLFHSLGLNYYGLHEKGLTSFILSKERLFNSPYISEELKNYFANVSDYELNKIISNEDMIDRFALTVNLQCELFNDDKIKNHDNIEDLLKKLPLYVDLKSFERDDGTPISGYSAWGQDLYNNTFFSYTYNTFATSNDTIHLTEKTWKDIMCFHPFLLVSNPGSLKQLRKLGYKTFSPYIDESYDDEKDFDKRSKMLFLEINRLCEMKKTDLLDWYSNQSDILIYNFKHFVKSNPAKETVDKIMELYKVL